jgi:hypothetical protein
MLCLTFSRIVNPITLPWAGAAGPSSCRSVHHLRFDIGGKLLDRAVHVSKLIHAPAFIFDTRPELHGAHMADMSP